MKQSKGKERSPRRVPELPLIGDVDDWEEDVIRDLLELSDGAACVFHIDSMGGNPYGALAVVTLMRRKRLQGTAVVLGECSSSALVVFAACQKRIVHPYNTFLFHRIRWESEKEVRADEARLWAEHFVQMETDMDDLQCRLFGNAEALIRKWIGEGRYLTGRQLAEAGLAELVELP